MSSADALNTLALNPDWLGGTIGMVGGAAQLPEAPASTFGIEITDVSVENVPSQETPRCCPHCRGPLAYDDLLFGISCDAYIPLLPINSYLIVKLENGLKETL